MDGDERETAGGLLLVKSIARCRIIDRDIDKHYVTNDA